MELHPFYIQGLVPQAHDLVHRTVFKGSPGGHFQALGQGFTLDHQRVVAGHGQRVVEAVKYAQVFVENRAGLAMHDLAGPHDITAKGLANGLVAQADTENRQLAGKVQDSFDGNTGLGRGARTRGNHDALGVQGFDLGDGQFVVANDFNLCTQLAEVLHDVVGEGVVIVDHQ
ncbi:hypothetical protein D3C78_649270 [compost metagenome]